MATTKKKKIPEMLPVRKWLTTSEVCAYLNCGETFLRKLLIRPSVLEGKNYYSVAEIDTLFEANRI
jgi:hypothetical protein